MTDRRTFLRGAGAGALLAALGNARGIFAEELARARPLTGALPTDEDYLLAPGLRYLNHGSIGTIPRVVHEAHLRYLTLCESNPWLYMWDEPWREPREAVRVAAAQALGCTPAEVAITHNTTEGFNLLAQGLPLGPGDEVLFSSLNHPGASLPWQHQAPARGFTVRRFDFPILDLPGLSEGEIVALHLDQITDRTRVLVLPHIDNIVGLRHPIAALARGAHARGVEFVAVDGAQAVSMVPVSTAAWDVDFYSASPHKWVQSPKGLGLLYLRAEMHERIPPFWVSSGQGGAAGTVRRFEDYGTRNLPEVMALGDALAFQDSIDSSAREAHHRAIWARMKDAVEATPGLTWRSPRQWELSAALYLVEVEGVTSADLFRRLYDEHGVAFRAFRTQGLDGARLSPNLQTPFSALETFLHHAIP